MISESPAGLHCEAGGFHVDPSAPVPVAVLTHVHADHAHPGAGEYHCTHASVPLLRKRLEAPAGAPLIIHGHPYGETFQLRDVRVSLHPSGHVLGSAQVRLERGGEVWVVSGDYKRAKDPTCEPFEVVRCDTFVTEATFALPVFRWDPPEQIASEIFRWWEHNREADKASVLICYSLGKAQRLLAELSQLTDRPVFVHGAIELITQLYREQGVKMLPTVPVVDTAKGKSFRGELVLAPRSARGQTWMRKFGSWEEAFVSGWMRIRGTRRRMSYDRGFALSDHADWPALLQTIEETQAKRVLCTHGYTDALSRYLSEKGVQTGTLRTGFVGEADIS